MRINRNNYESYFIDYLDGNLEHEVIDDFIEFINQNPDLREELELVSSVKLEPGQLVFEKKDDLFRPDFESQQVFNEHAIAMLEGDLSNAGEEQFRQYLEKHPDKQREAELFSKTRLVPDESIQYSRKKSLYREPAGKTILLWSLRIAAVLILAVAMYVVVQIEPDVPNGPQQAEVITPAPVEPSVEQAVSGKEKPSEQVVQEQETNENPAPAQKPVVQKPAPVVKKEPAAQREPEYVAAAVEYVDVPSKLPALKPSVTAPEDNLLAALELAPLKGIAVVEPAYPEEEKFLADIVKEKAGLQNISLNVVAKAGLNIVSNLSGDKFTYATNRSGEITALSLDTRLLAFSIPTNR